MLEGERVKESERRKHTNFYGNWKLIDITLKINDVKLIKYENHKSIYFINNENMKVDIIILREIISKNNNKKHS